VISAVQIEFDQPNLPTRVWRHIDLAQFAWMLATRAIWFSKVSSLEDKFEGSYPVPTAERLQAVESTMERLELPPEVGQDYVRDYSGRTLKSLRERVYVNCWYSGLNESAALWQWAERKGQSVAIRSTFGRLIGSCAHTERIYSSRVRYLNYQKDPVPFSHRLGIFFCKRKSFEHEREVRLLMEGLPTQEELPGVAVQIDLEQLIQRVVVAPRAPTWHLDVVRSLLERYGLGELAQMVHKSDLDRDPIF